MALFTNAQPDIYPCFEPSTGTWQYVVADPESRKAAIIDSVLDFDPAVSRISTASADKVLSIVEKHALTVTHIMETHAHADHLTAATYLKQQLLKLGKTRPIICIGKRIKQVQSTFSSKYNISPAELEDVFDKLFEDNEEFAIGNVPAKVLYLPGHTPDHVGYLIGTNVFIGDTLFNPDVGSARADFPGGSAPALYQSAQTLLSFPPHYRLYVGHDYPPATRVTTDGVTTAPSPVAYTTVADQRERNMHVKAGTTEEAFVAFRASRDAVLSEPKLLHQAMQVNIRAGRLPGPTSGGDRLLHVPVKGPKEVLGVM